MIEKLNEIIQNTPRGKIDVDAIRAQVNPDLHEKWEEVRSDVWSILITDLQIVVNDTVHIDCDSRQEAETFVLYLLASRNRGRDVNM